ncbi:MAG: Hsp20/alpha crystallin family protein [Bacteroidetes bacterium]|nr:Hsp20/alpha crystallin family protein [Bacteroidota bacterium]
MTTNAARECLVYPGTYTPMPEMQDIAGSGSSLECKQSIAPAMNLNEEADSFFFELLMPGISRENIVVLTGGNLLSVLVIPAQKGADSRATLQVQELVHEFDKGQMERQIELPANANTEFISAEFHKGVLTLHIPKTSGTPNTEKKQVIVY